MTQKQHMCLRCGRQFANWLKRPSVLSDRPAPARSTSIHVMDPNANFCTLRCAAEYGVAAAEQARRALDLALSIRGKETT